MSCLINHYASTTGMSVHPSITYDMTQYHNFREIGTGTPGAIIELGFMYADYDFLTQGQDVMALAIARGMLCYLRGENPLEANQPTPTPLP